MKCTVCGGRMNPVTTDLPFKLSAGRIAILKQLPVLQCETCQEYLLEDGVMARVDEMLARTDEGAELEVIRFVA